MALHGMMLLLQLISLAAVLLATTTMPAAAQAPPGCNESCGGVSVPYPFGLTDGCYLHVPGIQDSQKQPFKITCNTTTSQPSLQFLDSDSFPTKISDIFASENALHLMMSSSYNCYTNNTYNSTMDKVMDLNLPPSYTLSDRNKVYNLGCNKATRLVGYPLHVTNPEQSFVVRFSGVSLCQDEFGKNLPDTCTGFGCSVNSIPSGLQNISLGVWTLGTALGTTAGWGLRYPCSYGFVVDERNFTFAGDKSFGELKGAGQQLPVLVDWAIGNDTCEEAKKNETAFACKGENTECVDRADGYVCQCWEGYAGNPYLLNDCIDVDECKNNATLCSGPATCANSIGSYKCKCHKGYRNDDNDKNKCVKINETSSKNDTEMKISLGVSLSFLVVLMITFVIYHILKKSKFKKLCELNNELNGGNLLPQEMQKYQGFQAPKIYKLEELKKATNNFDVKEVIGEGGFGLVYKGTLPDNKVVAIKKSKIDPPTMTPKSRIAHSKQFINEMIVLSGIRHRNVVTLLGCCLETKTPILVYEFVSHGTLYEHIHKKKGKGPLSFGQRVKIAAETAGFLSYLHHSASSTQILHRDVKATNILLDENLTAKVSDFGASKLIPEEEGTQLATMVQGTLGYLDPEYIQTHKLTEKSDVYSFGVVLVELITSQVAINSNKKLETEKNLANCFLKSVENNQLDQILDREIIKEDEVEIAEQVAQLAKRCLSLKGDDRPDMIEVETELGAILAAMGKHPGGKPDSSPKDTDYLLAASPSNAFVVDVRSDEGEVITSIDYDQSMKNQAQMMKPYNGGR